MLLLDYDKIPPDLLEYFEPVDTNNAKDVFRVATSPYKEAHFATFPPKLIEPCIRAGCPAQVCGECGEPWVRVVEKEVDNSGYPNGPGGRHKQYIPQSNNLATIARYKTTTITFTPTCQCNAPTKPGIVLDPFMGSGTTAFVAIENGRDWLGIELNPEYIKLAEKRIIAAQPALFTF